MKKRGVVVFMVLLFLLEGISALQFDGPGTYLVTQVEGSAMLVALIAFAAAYFVDRTGGRGQLKEVPEHDPPA